MQKPVVRLAVFGLFLAVVFAAAAFAGNVIDPEPRDPAPAHGEAMAHAAGGEDAYALELQRSGDTLDLRVADAAGDTVRDFDVAHERRLHLIVVRRDLTGFQHLHPVQQPDGLWTTPLRLDAPGSYRVIADFEVDGEKHTPSADLQVDGTVRSRPLPPPDHHASVDGYDVALAHTGDTFSFVVGRAGQSVSLENYLGAKGHLVALRASDLEYIHVHPDADELSFTAELPSAGRYRLFLQFKAGGTVHTVPFTVDA